MNGGWKLLPIVLFYGIIGITLNGKWSSNDNYTEEKQTSQPRCWLTSNQFLTSTSYMYILDL